MSLEWARRPAPLDEIKRRVPGLLYLRTVDKILVALANEYGSDRKLPSREFIREQLAKRYNPKPYGGRMAEGCEL